MLLQHKVPLAYLECCLFVQGEFSKFSLEKIGIPSQQAMLVVQQLRKIHESSVDYDNATSKFFLSDPMAMPKLIPAAKMPVYMQALEHIASVELASKEAVEV